MSETPNNSSAQEQQVPRGYETFRHMPEAAAATAALVSHNRRERGLTDEELYDFANKATDELRRKFPADERIRQRMEDVDKVTRTVFREGGRKFPD